MSELEMKALEGAEMDEISGGMSLDDIKKWAAKHKKAIVITGATVGTVVAGKVLDDKFNEGGIQGKIVEGAKTGASAVSNAASGAFGKVKGWFTKDGGDGGDGGNA